MVEDRAPYGRKRVLPLKEGKNKGIIDGLIFRGLIMARKKAPELTFQEHIAAYLVRKHCYPVLRQVDVTDTEHCIAEDHLWAFLKPTQKETLDKLAADYGTDLAGRDVPG